MVRCHWEESTLRRIPGDSQPVSGVADINTPCGRTKSTLAGDEGIGGAIMVDCLLDGEDFPMITPVVTMDLQTRGKAFGKRVSALNLRLPTGRVHRRNS